jgi:hypothetical protein
MHDWFFKQQRATDKSENAIGRHKSLQPARASFWQVLSRREKKNLNREASKTKQKTDIGQQHPQPRPPVRRPARPQLAGEDED